MSAVEFDMWQAFNLLEPIGIQREDALAAHQSHRAYLLNGINDYTISDFMLFHNRDVLDDPANDEPTQDEIAEIKMNLYSMFGQN